MVTFALLNIEQNFIEEFIRENDKFNQWNPPSNEQIFIFTNHLNKFNDLLIQYNQNKIF